MQPVLQRLHDNGIGSILDYAAEVRGQGCMHLSCATRFALMCD